jgi:hypothetical protein
MSGCQLDSSFILATLHFPSPHQTGNMSFFYYYKHLLIDLLALQHKFNQVIHYCLKHVQDDNLLPLLLSAASLLETPSFVYSVPLLLFSY